MMGCQFYTGSYRRRGPMQKQAIDAAVAGNNVVVSAVPGAGKSYVLVDICKRRRHDRCLILSYNVKLKLDTEQRIRDANIDDRVTCLTFHGLCSRCLRLADDDCALFEALDAHDRAPDGVTRLPADLVLIDEAQDFRPSFLRLMHACLDLTQETRFVVVGDLRQTLYDYSPEDSASPVYFETPSCYFVSDAPWMRFELAESYRLPPRMAAMASRMFETDIVGVGTRPCEICVHTRRMCDTKDLVCTILAQHGVAARDTCILTPRKRGNAHLVSLVNHLSESGYRMYIHGVDHRDDYDVSKILVSSFHAAKGSQFRLVILYGVDANIEDNPLFVGMTRSCECLHVIQNAARPCVRLLNGIRGSDVTIDEPTRRALEQEQADANDVEEAADSSRALVDLQTMKLQTSGWWILRRASIVQLSPPGNCPKIARVRETVVASDYLLSALMAVEMGRTGKVRRMYDVFYPIRMDHDDRQGAIADGHQARFVSPCAPEPLKPGVYSEVGRAWRVRDTPAWLFLSCAFSSWGGFQHRLKDLVPIDWADADRLAALYECIQRSLPEEALLDVRVHRRVGDTLFYHRAHALSRDAVWTFVSADAITSAHKIDAALLVCCAPAHMTRGVIVNVDSHERVEVVLDEPTQRAVLDGLCDAEASGSHQVKDLTSHDELA